MNEKEVLRDEKNNKRRVGYLLLLLLFTGVLLSTSTYAWFTTNRIVSVDMINVKVQTEGSLEISVDGINFKPGVTEEEIIGAHNSTYPGSINQIPAYIEPVSTVGGLDNNGFMQMYFGDIRSNSSGDYIIVSRKSVETESYGTDSEGKFVAFDLFLRTSTAKDLYLTNNSKVTYNGQYSTGTENAIRLAFIVEGSVENGTNVNVIQGLSTSNTNNVYIWEPNYNSHTSTGIIHARNVYGISITENDNRVSYEGIKNEFSEIENVTFGKANSSQFPNYFSPVMPKILTVADNTEYQYFLELPAGITKVRVYMWLEGQDVDCENGASVGDISFNLEFSTNPS